MTRLHLPYLDDTRSRSSVPAEFVGISDATIDSVARRLPKLEELILYFHEITLTEAALVSLARYCKRLRYISISAKVSIPDLLSEERCNIFPALETLQLWEWRERVCDRYENEEELARRFLTIVPNIRTLNMKGTTSPADRRFWQTVFEMLRAREI